MLTLSTCTRTRFVEKRWQEHCPPKGVSRIQFLTNEILRVPRLQEGSKHADLDSRRRVRQTDASLLTGDPHLQNESIIVDQREPTVKNLVLDVCTPKLLCFRWVQGLSWFRLVPSSYTHYRVVPRQRGKGAQSTSSTLSSETIRPTQTPRYPQARGFFPVP